MKLNIETMESRTYEDMSKGELIVLVRRLALQNDEWRRLALREV